MPGAEAMTAFTPEADARLAEYLGQVRAALAAAPDVDPGEVEADIREHVETEFAGWHGPVGLPELEAILTRLGPPAAWAGGGPARPGWDGVVAGAKGLWADARRAAAGVWAALWRAAGRATAGVWAALWRGPEDWRLAYLTFGTFVVFLLSLPDLGRRPWPILLLAVAYILARAAVALAAERGVRLGARRWLVYPPLVLVSLPLLIGTLVCPLGVGIVATQVMGEAVVLTKQPAHFQVHAPHGGHQRLRDDAEYAERFLDAIPGPPGVRPVTAGVLAGVGAFAVWYSILGGLTWAYPGLPRAVFAPFLSGVTARDGRRRFTAALAVLVAWGVVAYQPATRMLAAAAAGERRSGW